MKELRPVRPDPDDFKELEDAIIAFLRKEIYLPLVAILKEKPSVLKNSTDDLIDAIQSGSITFWNGKFTGKFNAAVSRTLKSMGAKWDKNGWRITLAQLPTEVRTNIRASADRFERTMKKVDDRLKDIVPSELVDKLKLENIFDSTFYQVQKSFDKSVASLEIKANLTDAQRKQYAEEYSENLKIYVKKFTDEETAKLRKDMSNRTFSGARYEGAIKQIQESYGVSKNKAKFLARQETNLATAKFKEVRYKDYGITKYKWRCVAGSANHPVRPMHKALDGSIQDFAKPPLTNEDGGHNNPGEDFNCRCVAIPVIGNLD